MQYITVEIDVTMHVFNMISRILISYIDFLPPNPIPPHSSALPSPPLLLPYFLPSVAFLPSL